MRQEQSNNSNALALRFALRELRGGLGGFLIFLGCIALGVAAIGGVNSVAHSITSGIEKEGKAILGGDLVFSLVQRQVSSAQEAFLEGHGDVARQITMRAMVRLPDDSDQTLVELKAVDGNYPLFGSFTDTQGDPIILSEKVVAVEPVLLDRLGLKVGDKIELGRSRFTITAAIGSEPDKVGDNIGFGPKVLISMGGMEKTGLVQPGSVLRYHYKLRLDDDSDQNLASVIEQSKERFPEAGWRVRTRDRAAPALSRSVDRFSQFLTLVGLTSLIVGGVGVANATRAFLETKRPVIATMKSLGAHGSFVFNMYLMQILAIATLGILIGLGLAVAMPFLARDALGDLLPVSDGFLFFPTALGFAVLYGYLTTLIFAIWPLASSQEVKPTDLFRASGYAGGKRLPKARYVLALVVCVVLLVFCAVWFAENRYIASIFVGATAVSFALLRLVSVFVQWLAANAPHSRSAPLRMAIANIHRPGSLTPSVVLSLGLGLALLVALATIDGNLRRQITDNIPKDAPDFFFVDVQNTEIDQFRDELLQFDSNGKILAVPMLRGRVVSLKGIAASEFEPASGGEWVLQGDRGITYSKRVPENSTLAEGEWWPEGYSGPPLVSVSAEEAGELGLVVGDKLVINVLGRNIKAEIASLREVQWETLGINFVFVFSPNTFVGAPHSWLATLTASAGTGDGFDGRLLRGLAKKFPTVTAVRIRDALDTVNTLINQLATAIRAAALVALLTSVLVLAGALAAGNRGRVHDAVVFKTLGATRGTLIRMMLIEYALLGFATAVFALIAGSLAAWFVIHMIMGFEFAYLPSVAISTILTALCLTVILGLAGTWRVLGQNAAPILREL